MLKHYPIVVVGLITLITAGCGGGSGSTLSSDDEVQVLNPSISGDTDDATDDTTDDTDDPSAGGGSTGTAETCDNSADDDSDGLTDCDDDDCTADSACELSGGTNIPAETCTNSTDDDEDGLTDCDDSDCAEDTACAADDDADDDGYLASADDCDDTDASIYPGASETANDEIDQDCDGEDLITLTLDDINTNNTELLWVTTTGDDTADCAFATPCLTLQGAIDKLDSTEQSILVTEGTYRGGFQIATIPAKIYGGIYEDTSSGVWQADPKNHVSMITVSHIDAWIDITAGDGRNILNGLTIRAGNQEKSDSNKADLNIENADVFLKKVTVASASDNEVEESAMVKMVKAVYSADGDFTLDVQNSTFRSSLLVGQEGTTTSISAWLMDIQATHADAAVAIDISDSRFTATALSLNASAFGFIAGLTIRDSVGLNTAMQLEVSDNRFNIGSVTYGDGIVISAPVSGVIAGNTFSHSGSTTDYGLYANVGSASTLTSTLRLSNNIFNMDNTSGDGLDSYAVYLKSGTALFMTNNTVAHTNAVFTGYGLYVKEDVDLGITLTNNIFSNVDTSIQVNIYLNEVPTTALALSNNLFYTNLGDMVVNVNDGTSISTYYSEADLTTALASSFTFRNNLYAIDPDFTTAFTPQAVELIDAGYLPASIDTSELVDILGNSRVVDGDGDGTATIDIGAVEIEATE